MMEGKNVEVLLAEAVDITPRLDPWKMRCWRELRELTQGQVAQRIGLGPRRGDEAVCRLENWQLSVGPLRLQRLAQALSVKVAQLQSAPSDLAASRERFDSWSAEGRPDVRQWLQRNRIW